MYASRSRLNPSESSRSRPRKNSSLMCPKTCSVAPLSMQLPLARHALGEAVVRERLDVGPVLVLPAHVRVQNRRRGLGLGGHEHLEHLLLLGEVGVRRYRVRHDLLALEVVDRREVGLVERAPELSDVGAYLWEAVQKCSCTLLGHRPSRWCLRPQWVETNPSPTNPQLVAGS